MFFKFITTCMTYLCNIFVFVRFFVGYITKERGNKKRGKKRAKVVCHFFFISNVQVAPAAVETVVIFYCGLTIYLMSCFLCFLMLKYFFPFVLFSSAIAKKVLLYQFRKLLVIILYTSFNKVLNDDPDFQNF